MPKEMFPELKRKSIKQNMSVLEWWACPNAPDCFIVLSFRVAVGDNELYYALHSLSRVEVCVCVCVL